SFESLRDDRHRRGASGRHLGDRAPQPRRRLRIAHEPLAPPVRFKPPTAVLLIELVQHAGALCPRHSGLDLRDRMLGAAPGPWHRRWALRGARGRPPGCRRVALPLGSPAPSSPRRTTTPRRCASWIAGDAELAIPISAHGREIGRPRYNPSRDEAMVRWL